MRLPSMERSPSRFLAEGWYHLAKLRAEPELDELAATFAEAHARLEARVQQLRGALSVRADALVVRKRKHMAAIAAIQRFSHDIRMLCGNDLGSAIYRRYFPKGTVSVTHSRISALVGWMQATLPGLVREEHVEIAVHREPLARVLHELEGAVDDAAKARLAVGNARASIHGEKLAWLSAYRQSYNRLCIHFHGEPKRAEFYFRKRRRTGGGAGEVAEDPEDAAETPAGAAGAPGEQGGTDAAGE